MFRAFAEMLTCASLPIWLCTLTYTFVWRAWHFLPSFLFASFLVAPLLGLAIVCEHRDAVEAGRPPRSFFPSPEGFARCLFVVILLIVCCSYAVVIRVMLFQIQIRWLIRHPNTINLFAAAIASVSTAVLLWKIGTRSHRENELSHE